LHRSARTAKLSAFERRHVGAVEQHLSRLRARQLHDRLAGRRLPAARLTYQPERLAGQHVETHVGDRVHLQSGVANRELDDELLDAQQRVSGCPQVRGAGARHYATTDAGGAVAAAPPTGKPAAVTPAARLSASARFPASVPTG